MNPSNEFFFFSFKSTEIDERKFNLTLLKAYMKLV